MKSLDVSRVLKPLPPHVVFTGIPMPINSNGSYSTSSSLANEYSKKLSAWATRNSNEVKNARKTLRKWGDPLKASLYFVFSKSNLINKQNTLKKNDVISREKLILFTLSKLLKVEYSNFVSLELESLVSASTSEQLIVVIKPTKIRSVVDIYSQSEDSPLV